MEIILKQDIKTLGHKDDIVKVRDGYGRNFLIPRGLALVASENNKKVHAETLRQRAFKEEKIKKTAEKLADTLKNVTIKIAAKVGDSGKIFGSITPLQLSEVLNKKGFAVDRRQIHFNEEHIKSTGTYEAELNLHKDVVVKLSFEVVAE